MYNNNNDINADIYMKITKSQKLHGLLDSLEVGEVINIRKYVLENWDRFDHYTKRSFDVVICNTKKLMSHKKFDSRSKEIIRIL